MTNDQLAHDIKALTEKFDALEAKVDQLDTVFRAANGVLALIKYCAAIGAAFAGIWTAIHLGGGK